MIVRWIGAGILDAQPIFRRIRGFRDLNTLFQALERHAEHETLDHEEQVA